MGITRTLDGRHKVLHGIEVLRDGLLVLALAVEIARDLGKLDGFLLAGVSTEETRHAAAGAAVNAGNTGIGRTCMNCTSPMAEAN